ncbi:hypothetical protein [Spartinivicinus poritis]|uniref:Uncharacterized protein n=1 Tax=Spartinivicinus poritis TaxID=2994640 RepID=A0ABT5UHN1_9GAMM|nr:hypothetical protein [Spartinivicinus sp. A2-2]MDE1465720.1 hypothetical protein [Spartinivicinus sp. A2-2]
MGLSAYLVLSDELTNEIFCEFCTKNNGVFIAESDSYSFSEEKGNVWVSVLGDEEPVSGEEIEQYSRLLCAPPRTQILFEVGWESKSEAMYLELALKMMTAWNGILCDLNENFLTKADVEIRLKAIG